MEYPIVPHCNLRCRGCDHLSPCMEPEEIPLERVSADVSALTGVLRTDDFKILGGEPLLHRDLLPILRSVRESRIAPSLTLFTNGLLLHRADPALFETVTRIGISLYPGVKLRITPKELRAISRRYKIRIEYLYRSHFRTAYPPSEIRDGALVRRIYRGCKLTGPWSCHTLWKGYFYKCSRAPFLTLGMKLSGLADVPPAGENGVALIGNANLREEMESYLCSPEPLEACRWCLGSMGRINRQEQGGICGPPFHEDEEMSPETMLRSRGNLVKSLAEMIWMRIRGRGIG